MDAAQLEEAQKAREILEDIARMLKVPVSKVVERVREITAETERLRQEVSGLRAEWEGGEL